MSLWNHAKACSRFSFSSGYLIPSLSRSIQTTTVKPSDSETNLLYENLAASLLTSGVKVSRTPKRSIKAKKSKRAIVSAAEKATDETETKSDEIVNTLTAAIEATKISPLEERKLRRREKRAKVALRKKQAQSGWAPEPWKTGWGEDTLKPSLASLTKSRHRPVGLFPAYSRRTEGLLEDNKKAVLQDLPSPTKQNPIATLSHGLERVLFNPGVHWLRDPRSRVYNFPPALEIVPKVVDFAFERLTGFVKSSRDEDLWTLVKKEGKNFSGSTSSLSGILSQIYFLISGNKRVDVSPLSQVFKKEPTNFTPGQRMAASVVFNYRDGVYAIDSDPSKNDDVDKNILTWMGTLLEKYLTMPSEEFLTYMRSHPTLAEALEGDPAREAYRYSKSEKFVMRSQLDCYDTRLPGTGVFDIKTRACLPIRMDLLNYDQNSGYLIRHQHGVVESFEREYYDLIRSAFLKYSFQVRIGNMDGVLVAYHNTERMFGFQYVPLEEMDKRLFGPKPGAGDRVFQKCVELMEVVAEEIVSCFPGQSVRCTLETLENSENMNIWIEPLDWTPDATTSTDNADAEQPLPPIKQIVVSTNSFLDDKRENGFLAVEDINRPWTLHWSVVHLTGGPSKEADMRAALNGAKERQFRAYSFPDGIDSQSIRQWWEGVDFARGVDENQRRAIKKLDLQPGVPPIDGAKVSAKTEDGMEVEVDLSAISPRKPDSFFLENFQSPDARICKLRWLAQEGRMTSIQQSKEERGKPKVQLGLGEVPWVETELDILHQQAEKEMEKPKESEGRVLEEIYSERMGEDTDPDSSAQKVIDHTGVEADGLDTDLKLPEEPRSIPDDPTRPVRLHGDVTATALDNQPIEGEQAVFASGVEISSTKVDGGLPKELPQNLTDGDREAFAEERVRLTDQAHLPPVEMEEPHVSDSTAEISKTTPHSTSVDQGPATSVSTSSSELPPPPSPIENKSRS
ncbi:Pet127-domain-containing protein [Dendrothele bispora CBS 962.96]|uniref:Pet127-domain-containing protein n=1 Tax=Dendrothele bispora (strain CBS 962.96) TaxID=1314807 RepID=A0A4S8MQR9_DENBC|nr:Pet127-domain-containing protein [Dendrothele bispora CBS 962.96]